MTQSGTSPKGYAGAPSYVHFVVWALRAFCGANAENYLIFGHELVEIVFLGHPGSQVPRQQVVSGVDALPHHGEVRHAIGTSHAECSSMPSCPDIYDALDRATQRALALAESGPLTERSPHLSRAADSKEKAPEPVRLSGTYRVESLHEGDAVPLYLLQESHYKTQAAREIDHLALSLRELRCPAEFARRVERAAHEKVRHANALLAQSKSLQGAISVPSAEGPPLDLITVALQTATQRCVAETYAATRFAYQARRALCAPLRGIFAEIARDDRIHAALFWELLEWTLSQISPARGRRIAEEQRNVHDLLRFAVEAPLPEEIHLLAGFPDVETAHALLDALEYELWSEVAA